jgi:hypothetical protein
MAPPYRDHPLPSKGIIVFALLVLLAVISIASIVALVGIVARDGYRRAPKRTLVRIF